MHYISKELIVHGTAGLSKAVAKVMQSLDTHESGTSLTACVCTGASELLPISNTCFMCAQGLLNHPVFAVY